MRRTTMVRPRNVLLANFPGLSPEEASDALRRAGGNIDAATRAISAGRGSASSNVDISNDDSDGDTKAILVPVGEPGATRTPSDTAAPNAAAAAVAAASGASSHLRPRVPPRHTTAINNLSDRQYCCVWGVEVFEDGYRPDVARVLLATVARHVNPILRDRGWRVKRLIESASSQWIGLCTGNGRNDADAASTNIQLNLRTEPSRHCRTFRPFHQILSVMLHEITHTSIGLEDIHPPAFYELLDEIKGQYREKVANGEVDEEKDEYGCNGKYITNDGVFGSVAASASDVLDNSLGLLGEKGSEGDCGASKKKGNRRRRRRAGGNTGTGTTGSAIGASTAPKDKKRPLLKGKKMMDKRTKVGKAAMIERENLTPRELAAKAALARLGSASSSIGSMAVVENVGTAGERGNEFYVVDSSDDDDITDSRQSIDQKKKNSPEPGGNDDDEDTCMEHDVDGIVPHNTSCGCRSCDWSKMFFMPDSCA